MKLSHHLSLAYCTNVHRGEGWEETFAGLRDHAMRVRDRVSPGRTYVLGLRLGHRAAEELSQPETLKQFRHWLDRENCIVAGINGFPYGAFHGQAVKDQVFAPDWCDPARLAYTQKLFELLATFNPPDKIGTVSTLPGTFKGFGRTPDELRVMRQNLLACGDYVRRLRDRTGVTLRLALEPEPIGHAENTPEAIQLFAQLRAEETSRGLVDETLGICYDTCHFALQYEEAHEAITRLHQGGAPILKYHLSSALSLKPTPVALARLAKMHEPTYLHQTMGRTHDGKIVRFKDIPLAMAAMEQLKTLEEVRVHFHVPVNAERLSDELATTQAHLRATIAELGHGPARELEIETYTWEVLPPEVRTADVADMIAAEYRWTLAALAQVGIKPL